jgi:hypothetical protein
MHDHSMPRGVIADTSPSSSLSLALVSFLLESSHLLLITLLITFIKFVDKVLILYSEKICMNSHIYIYIYIYIYMYIYIFY